jgi:sugar phosphate isomerase/epimerase
VDLTVRKDGHVAPERATEDLPKAVGAIRAEGLEVPMITTNLLSATEPDAAGILTAAGKLGIPSFKPGYYKYDFVDVRRELQKATGDFRGLAKLAQQLRVQTGYHNHGGYIGGPVWDIAEMLDGLDPAWAGYYFDAAHAVAEGGEAGWKVALNRAAPRLKMVAVKDFYWEKSARGWRPKFCPLGEGMVDWKWFFSALAKAGFQGPISIHIEYDPGSEAAVLEAARRDLEFVKAHL